MLSYKVHSFHLMMDKGLLLAIKDYMIEKKIRTREGAVNSIIEIMEAYIDMIVAGGHEVGLQDSPLDYKTEDNCDGLSESVIINIRDYNFDKLRFLHFRFDTFSIATVLRRLLRLFLILRREDVLRRIKRYERIFRGLLGWGNKFKIHMGDYEPQTTTAIYLDYKYRIKKLLVRKRNI